MTNDQWFAAVNGEWWIILFCATVLAYVAIGIVKDKVQK